MLSSTLIPFFAPLNLLISSPQSRHVQEAPKDARKHGQRCHRRWQLSRDPSLFYFLAGRDPVRIVCDGQYSAGLLLADTRLV